MNRYEIDLDQYEKDFASLQSYEENALIDLKEVEALDYWKPTEYERYFLPQLRLAGIKNRKHLALQNSADLHIHTEWSDGDNLDLVLQQAVKMGLDAIAITDHDEIEGALEARRRVHEQRLRLAVIPGCEISSRDGHIGALFVMKTIPKNLSAKETVSLIHEAGGIAVAHHPYPPVILEKMLRMKLGCRDLIKTVPFDAIECTNAVPGRAVKYNIEAIEQIRKLHVTVAVTGSSDAPCAKFVGKGKTYFAGNEGLKSLKESLVYGFTQGAEGYWKFSEKILYFSQLVKSTIKNSIKRLSSIN